MEMPAIEKRPTRGTPFRLRLAGLCLSALAGAILGARPGHAHKPITSKYSYNDDVFPIFRDRCGRCHVTGGVGPMSLLTYKEAYPWAESLRDEILSGRRPPWHPDALSARELDAILAWASGGTPEGSAATRPPAVTLKNEWPLGQPDLALPMPSEFVLPADTLEDTREFILPTGNTRARWIKAVDLLPGTPAIVRDALIYLRPRVRSGKSARGRASGSQNPLDAAPEIVLAAWMPRQDPAPPPNAARFRVPADAELVLRVHYKKTWKHEGIEMRDRSTVGLYFTEPPTDRR